MKISRETASKQIRKCQKEGFMERAEHSTYKLLIEFVFSNFGAILQSTDKLQVYITDWRNEVYPADGTGDKCKQPAESINVSSRRPASHLANSGLNKQS